MQLDADSRHVRAWCTTRVAHLCRDSLGRSCGNVACRTHGNSMSSNRCSAAHRCVDGGGRRSRGCGSGATVLAPGYATRVVVSYIHPGPDMGPRWELQRRAFCRTLRLFLPTASTRISPIVAERLARAARIRPVDGSMPTRAAAPVRSPSPMLVTCMPAFVRHDASVEYAARDWRQCNE